MAAVFLGIDSSCYTTSLAVCNIAGDILVNRKVLLPAEKNQRGIRQSEAVFLHIKNLQKIFEDILLSDLGEIRAVAASVRPRPQDGSYMPVFQVSKSIAAAVSSATGAFFMETTHQHAHIAAAQIGNRVPESFVAVHLSGGTSEILTVYPNSKAVQPDVTVKGGTLDLPAGQLIDRVGQRMGFVFPCGPSMEECARNGQGTLCFKTSVEGLDFHFSGVEAQAYRALDAHEKKQEICLAVQNAVSQTIAQALSNACNAEKTDQALLFGGVISNAYIKEKIKNHPACKDLKLLFAKKEFSSDNAAGLSVMAKDYYNRYCKEEL